MKIGNIDLGDKPVMLAPMEDVTDIGFRMLCKRFGASMVYTEFVSAEALVRSIQSTVNKLTIRDEERPVGIQIYGRDVEAMVEAARIVEQAAPDVIDLNFGCPVKKVAGKGAGAGMLQNIPLMLDITRRVVQAVKLPVTVKTRLGWSADNLVITTLAEQLQDCGIAALTVHGRTRAQMYTGSADWTLIREVKQNPRIRIPIIGNGDITTPQQAADAFADYGVDGVMVGRATFGCPWIFRDIQEVLHPEKALPPLSYNDRINLLIEQLNINVERIDEYRGILHTRRHLAATPIFKGIPNFRSTRIAMLRATTVAELTDILKSLYVNEGDKAER
ncbi:MAG: tRNA dihydrouridine synthase DusB [Prevotella sp.]